MRAWMFLVSLTLASVAAAAKPPAPPSTLFASDVPIHITIQGPIQALVANRNSPPLPATLTAGGVAYPITLGPRGIFRRETCDFPPLKVAFTRAPPAGSLFEHQHDLKLVAHCKRSPDFQQKVLLEYSAYRLYNLITPVSFRARLANIDYVDASGRPYVSRVGFFIEPLGEVAKRNGLAVAHMGSRVPLEQIDPVSGGRFAVFEYMISNYDWSMRAGPAGEDCCHNGRMLTNGVPGTLLTVVPYDFDFSGLVNAPYADPPESVPVSSVRQRLYRGYCSHLAQARGFAAQLSARRAEFLGVFATIPGLEPSEQARAAAYLQGFFSDVDSGKIFKTCIN